MYIKIVFRTGNCEILISHNNVLQRLGEGSIIAYGVKLWRVPSRLWLGTCIIMRLHSNHHEM